MLIGAAHCRPGFPPRNPPTDDQARMDPCLAAASAGSRAAVRLYPSAGCPDLHRQLLVDAARPPSLDLRRLGKLCADDGRPDLHAGHDQQPHLCRHHHSRLDRHLVVDGAVRAPQDRGAGLSADGLFHADRAAADRGGQHMAVLLPAGIRPVRPDPRAFRPAAGQLDRPALDGALLDHRGDRLESGRLLHDLLPGSAPDDPREPARGGRP